MLTKTEIKYEYPKRNAYLCTVDRRHSVHGVDDIFVVLKPQFLKFFNSSSPKVEYMQFETNICCWYYGSKN